MPFSGEAKSSPKEVKFVWWDVGAFHQTEGWNMVGLVGKGDRRWRGCTRGVKGAESRVSFQRGGGEGWGWFRVRQRWVSADQNDVTGSGSLGSVGRRREGSILSLGGL